MTKNKTMRLASLLLVLVLLSTCVISGTFAKYVTSDKGGDSARVAKWGVTALVNGSLFGADYNSVTATASNEISATYTGSADSATSADGDDIVAPGTQNTNGVTIKVDGTPEVASKVTFESTTPSGGIANQDIFLKNGTYGVMVKVANVTEDNYEANKYYTLSSTTYTVTTEWAAAKDKDLYVLHDEATINDTTNGGYYPLTWTVDVDGTQTEYKKVSALVAALAGESGSYNALDSLDKTIGITWAWDFNTNDGGDTILGNLAAGNELDGTVVKKTSGTTYGALASDDSNLKVALNYSVTVTQED